MTIKLEYHKGKKILYGFCDGPLTTAEFRSAMDEIVSSNEYQPDVRTIWCASGVEMGAVDQSFLEQFISVRGDYPERASAKFGIVAPKDIGFGMSRMYQVISDELPQDIRVFRELVEAEKWLLEG